MRDQLLDDGFDIFDRAGAVAVEHTHHLADLAEQLVCHHQFGRTGRQDGGDADAILRRKLRDRPEGGEADAPPQDHDVLPAWAKREPDAERPHHVAIIAGLERRHAPRATPHAFVEEFEVSPGGVHGIDALGAPQPQIAVIGRGAENVEELAWPAFQMLGRSLDDQMLVFGIDPDIADDLGDGFLGRDVRRRIGGILATDNIRH